MRKLSALVAIGLLTFALSSPLGARSRAGCVMSCCRTGMAMPAHAGPAQVACSLHSCNNSGTGLAGLPSLPASVLPIPLGVAAPGATGTLDPARPAHSRSLPHPLPEQPPRA